MYVIYIYREREGEPAVQLLESFNVRERGREKERQRACGEKKAS